MGAVGYLYLAQEGGERGLVKIGAAVDPRRRLARLQTGNPRKLRLLDTWAFPSFAAAKAVERDAHVAFRDKRVAGEWFDFQGEPLAAVAFAELRVLGVV